MKCPKCGYTNFDYLDSCKKCGNDISDVRSMLGVIAIAPEDRAVLRPKRPAPRQAAPQAAPATADPFGAPTAAPLGREDETIGGMESMVEPTSYAGGKPSAVKRAGQEEGDEEFLPMADFEDVFKE